MKILIIQQKMIGDVLTSSILFKAIKDTHPKAELHYLINTHTFSVVENNPYIDEFIFFTHEAETSKKALFKLAKAVRKEKFDVVIDVYSKLSSNLITLISGAKTKISYNKFYTRFIYNTVFNEHKKAKTIAGLAIENRLKLLKPLLGHIPEPIQPKIYLTPKEIEASKQLLVASKINLSQPLFMISVLGSGDNKTYPFQYMAKIIDTIVEKTNGQLLFNYIPKQEKEARDIYDLCHIETQQKIHLNIFGKNLREFLAITKHCTAVIGNEGGAINMAKGLAIPTFSIFSPWILKDAWNMFEDGKKHTSIHLNDVNPKLYEGKSLKDIKKQVSQFYQAFNPNDIIPKLAVFLNNF